MKYQILESRNTINLEDEVKRALKNGWVLQGGIAAHQRTVNGDPHFFQAMCKPEIEE